MQGVHRLVERWNLSTKGRVKGMPLLKVHRVEEIKYLEVFEILPQGVCAGVLLKPKFVSEISGGITPLNYFEERQGSNSSSQSKVHKEEPWFILHKFSRSNEKSKFSVENSLSHEDCGIPVKLQEG
jgi:hypothetical protein